jgi:hypothetical protein
MKTFLQQLFIATALIALPATSSFAQRMPSDPAPHVEIFPGEVTLQNLPMPGSSFTVKVKLSNTKDIDRRLRAFVVRDGRVSDVAPTRSYLDEYDQPTYEVEFFAPLAELAYQFVLYNPDGTFSTSRRISVRRPCVPYVDLDKVKLEPKTQGEARLSTLVKLSKSLEREITAYDTTDKLLDELAEKLKK